MHLSESTLAMWHKTVIGHFCWFKAPCSPG